MIEFKDYQKSKVVVGETYKNLLNYIPKEKQERLVIITDVNVGSIYKKDFPKSSVIEIGVGEAIKTQDTITQIIEQLINLEADRHNYIVGVGGGVVCDITGYVASIFMRGIPFGYVSTSLLSQIDASIGGKTGVNFKGYKNLIGVFSQPDFVICDQEMLNTLPKDELTNGIAEAVKHALIADADYFQYIDQHAEEINSLQSDVVEKVVTRSIEIKTTVVERDERESHERKKLNFGHTFGHAIETLSKIPHGQAVSIGMVKAVKLSAKLGYCKPELVDIITAHLNKLGLPTSTSLTNEILVEVIFKDKKRKNENVDFVFLRDIGEVEIKSVPILDLIK